MRLGWSLVLIVCIGIAWWLWQQAAQDTPVSVTGELVTVIRTEEGYEPNLITISVGDTVRWENLSDTHHWPAADIHPSHATYPAFDPQSPVAPGEMWEFTFTQIGEWSYHDHLRPAREGAVIVTE